MTNEKFASMQELVNYLDILDKRIIALEKENKDLKDAINEIGNETLINRRRKPSRLPRTDLLSTRFLPRAFAVWGHFFVANLIIGVILSIIYLLIFVVLFGSFISNFSR